MKRAASMLAAMFGAVTVCGCTAPHVMPPEVAPISAGATSAMLADLDRLHTAGAAMPVLGRGLRAALEAAIYSPDDQGTYADNNLAVGVKIISRNSEGVSVVARWWSRFSRDDRRGQDGTATLGLHAGEWRVKDWPTPDAGGTLPYWELL
jgi:hypothetical protein